VEVATSPAAKAVAASHVAAVTATRTARPCSIRAQEKNRKESRNKSLLEEPRVTQWHPLSSCSFFEYASGANSATGKTREESRTVRSRGSFESSLRRPIPTESAPRKPRRRPGGKRSPSGRTWPKEENEGSSGRKEPGAGVVAPATPQPDESEHPHTNEREGRRLGHDVEATPSRELGERA